MQTDGVRLRAQLMYRAVRRNGEVLSLYSAVGQGGSGLCHSALPKASHLPTNTGCSMAFQEASLKAKPGVSFNK